jgi:5'-nucleotidase
MVNLRLQTQAGEEILYVGDHLYSDVLRSKRTLGWRTTLIVPELTNEMAVFRANREVFYQIIQLRKLRDDMSSYADSLKRIVPWTAETEQQLLNLQEDDSKVKEVLTSLTERYHRAFHPVCEYVLRVLVPVFCFFFFFFFDRLISLMIYYFSP